MLRARGRAVAPRSRALGALALALALAACVGGGGGLVSETVGFVDVETDEHGAWSYAPDHCHSGEWQQFFGVDLVEGDDAAARITRIVQDPIDGATVAINVPGEDVAVVFTGEGCERFDVLVERDNSRVNNIWNVFGRADILCEAPDARLELEVIFDGCH
ncbi:MAG: hypothetical protein H6713_30540 [Myxococcales bacterium]|nr:hypothetical protein [Myxococcales bacterium]